MDTFLLLHHPDYDEPVRVNSSHIRTYGRSYGHTAICWPDDKYLTVLETPEQLDELLNVVRVMGQDIECTRPVGAPTTNTNEPYDPLAAVEDYFFPQEPGYDLVAHLHRQKAFSEKTFGPGTRTKGVCDHIRKELTEIEADPTDLMEWIDIILLGMDGAWRSGASPEEIAAALDAKLTRNESRTWPDWRTADPDKAIEHVR